MKPFALEMQQGITPNTPAAKRRWGVRLTILLFLSFGTFLGTPVGFCQQPTSGQKSKAQEDQQKEKTEGAKDKEAASSAKAQKPAWHIQVQKQEFGGPLISISAKKAPLGPIVAELERQIGIPVVLTPLVKEQILTTDFSRVTLEVAFGEVAMAIAAQRPTFDYVINGGADGISERKAIAVYLIAYNETPPRTGPYTAHEAAGILVSMYIPATLEEQKQIEEKRKKDLIVSVKDDRFQVRAHEMALTEAAEAIAVKVGVPFIILSRDYNQKELDQKVDWDIKDATLEEIAAGWFPDAVRLYLRTDFETGSTRPLRITLERSSREQPQQGEGRTQQNVEP